MERHGGWTGIMVVLARLRRASCRKRAVQAAGGLAICCGLVTLPHGAPVAQEIADAPDRGTSIQDLTSALTESSPLDLLPQDRFEFVVAEGVVRGRGPRETADPDWSPAKSCYPAWGETEIEVEKAVAVNSQADTAAGLWTFVERHAYFRDDDGEIHKPWWGGKGNSQYNRLQVGDRVIVVAVRRERDSCFYYSMEFWPHFSVVFNVVLPEGEDGDAVCIDAPWRSEGPGYRAGEILAGRVGPSEVVSRREHCFSVSPNEAFEAIVETVRKGS